MSDSDGKAITDVEGISIKSEAELKSDAFLAELKGADTITDYNYRLHSKLDKRCG